MTGYDQTGCHSHLPGRKPDPQPKKDGQKALGHIQQEDNNPWNPASLSNRVGGGDMTGTAITDIDPLYKAGYPQCKGKRA